MLLVSLLMLAVGLLFWPLRWVLRARRRRLKARGRFLVEPSSVPGPASGMRRMGPDTAESRWKMLPAIGTANWWDSSFIRTKADKERIIAARDLVNERLDNPPNLSEIARMVGLNEYKLKRGFKETFRSTVFGYLSEQRLRLAFEQLKGTQKTASEIAADLGYATPQHFNNAFKKKFGMTPQMVRKNP